LGMGGGGVEGGVVDLYVLRWPRHGFLASTTERHAGGRDMAPMGHQRSSCACCCSKDLSGNGCACVSVRRSQTRETEAGERRGSAAAGGQHGQVGRIEG
jgi:hypothetical protein